MRLAASPRRRALAAVTATALLAGGLQLFAAQPASAAVRVSSFPVTGPGLQDPPIFVSPALITSTYDAPLSAASFSSLETQGLPAVEQPLCRATSRVAGNVISCQPGQLADGLYRARIMFDDAGQLPVNLNTIGFRVSTAAEVTAPETATVDMASALPITGAFPYAATVTVTVRNVVGQRTAPVTFNPADVTAGTFSGVLDVASLGRGTLTVEARATENRNNSTKTAEDTVVVDPSGPGPVLIGGRPQPGSRVGFTSSVAAFYDRPLSRFSTITVERSDGTAVAGCDMQLDTDGDTAADCSPGTSLRADTYTVTTSVRDDSVPPALEATTDTYTFVVDLTAPRFLDASITPDPVTSLTTQVLTVAGRTDEPNGRLQVRLRDSDGSSNDDRIVNATSDAQGRFSVPVDVAALAEGFLTVQVVAFDEAVNPNTFLDSVLKDTRAPVLTSSTPANGSTVRPPSVVTLVFDEALRVASSTVVLLDRAGDTVRTTSAASGSTLRATPTVTLRDGSYRAVATYTDAVGNPATATVAFTVDGTPPPQPTLTLPAAVANVATARGTGEPGATATVVLTDAQGASATGTVLIGADGTYAVDVDVSDLGQGELAGRTTATDAAGNRSVPSAPVTTRRDSVAPAVTVDAVRPDPLNAQTARTVDVTGTVGEDDARLVLVVTDRLGRTVSATATSVMGRYVFQGVDVTSLADGTLTFVVQASDALGNTATDRDTAVLDATAPPVTDLTVDPSRIGSAADQAVEVRGTTEPGSIVDVLVTDANDVPVSATATAGLDGAFRVVLDLTALADGVLTVTAQATDRAGNQGEVAGASAVKDATPPPAPTVVAAPASLANAATYTVTGLTEAGATVTVVISDGTDSATRTVTAGPDGGYAATFDVRSLDDGTLTLTATAVDGFGNASPTTRTTREKDTVAPATPAEVRIVDDPVRGPADGPATATVTGRITDTVRDGFTVEVVFTDGTRSTAPVLVQLAADGSFTAAVDIAGLDDGPVTVRVVAVDRVGNRSAAGTDTAVKDTVALALVSSDPRDGSRVPPRTTVSATYSEPLDAATSTVVVRNADGNRVEGTVSTDGRTLTFTRDQGTFSTLGAPYTATFDVGDRAGERRTDTVTFGIIDAPTVQLTDPITSANADRVVAGGTTEPGATVTVTLSGVGADVEVTAVADATGAYATAPTSVRSLGDGTVTATARATATDGAVSGTATDTARKDTIAPVLEGSSPADGAAVRSADAVTLTYDEAPDTATVTVRGPAGPVAGTVTSETRTVVFRAAAPLADGGYVVTAVVRDALGNERTSTVSFTVDSTPPPLTLTATDVGARENPFTEFRGTTEPGLTITTTLTSGDRSSTGTSLARADGTFNGFVDLTDFPQGRFTVTSVVQDAAGNRTTATTTAVKDTVAPAVTGLSATAPNPSTTVTGSTEPGARVTVTARDAAGATVSGTATVDPQGRFTAALDLSSLAAGTITVTATATDGFGNAGSASTTTTKTGPAPASPSPSPVSPSPAGSPSVSPGTSPSASPSPVTPVQTGDGYLALTSPVRVLDSRTPIGTTRGLKRGAVVVDLSSRVPADATAAVLNVTVTNPSANGFVVVYPGGNAKPGTSNVNFLRGQTQANEVVVGLPADKRVVVFVDSAQANVIADLVGSFTPSATGRVVTQVPERVLDSRVPIGTTRGVKRGEVVLDLSGRLPAGATSVALNVTVTAPSARGFVVVYPTGTTRPGTSNVNFERGQTQANEVVTRVGAGGRVSILVDSAAAHVIADLVAVVVPSGGQLFTPLAQPQRVLDSRPGSGNVGTSAGRKAGNVVLTLPAGVVPAGATGVVLNVTTTGASRTGFVSVFPTGTANPGTSNVNFRPGANQANEVLTAVDAQRRLTLFVGGSGGPVTHVIADVVGYLTPGS